MGHSFGTYLSMQAIKEAPELYEAYVGVGQVSDKTASELDNLEFCLAEAKKQDNQKDITCLYAHGKI